MFVFFSCFQEQKITFCQIAEANQKATTSLQASQMLQKETGRLQAACNSITLVCNNGASFLFYVTIGPMLISDTLVHYSVVHASSSVPFSSSFLI